MSATQLKPSTSVHAAAAVLPKIVYIGGTGRSGSTLVGRVLGEAPGAICIGETRYLWSRGLIHDVGCGCGESFRSCSFWTDVGNEAFGGWATVDAQRMVELDRLTVRLRSLPLHWCRAHWRGFGRAAEEYVAALRALYAAIAAVSGARMVVDMSKEPNFALLLARMPRSDVRIVHLVRDSRAVAYSWTRRKPLPSPIGQERFMPQFRPTDIATRWLFWNAAFDALARRHPRSKRICYETFVAAPRQTLSALGAFLEEPRVQTLSALGDDRVTLGGHHMFSGNPMRADTGEVRMRLDDEWQWMMPSAQLAKVTAITWPQLRRYGYRIVPPQRRPTSPRCAGRSPS
jgi:hypothetical protein